MSPEENGAQRLTVGQLEGVSAGLSQGEKGRVGAGWLWGGDGGRWGREGWVARGEKTMLSRRTRQCVDWGPLWEFCGQRAVLIHFLCKA